MRISIQIRWGRHCSACGDRLLPIDGFPQLEAERFEDFAEQQAVFRLVLGDEEAIARLLLCQPRHAASPRPGGSLLGREQRHRYLEIEDRAFTRFASDTDLPTHEPDILPAYSEPEAGPPLRGRPFSQLHEGREHPLPVLFADAGAGVLNLESHHEHLSGNNLWCGRPVAPRKPGRLAPQNAALFSDRSLTGRYPLSYRPWPGGQRRRRWCT